jgi:hypothetical protein
LSSQDFLGSKSAGVKSKQSLWLPIWSEDLILATMRMW